MALTNKSRSLADALQVDASPALATLRPGNGVKRRHLATLRRILALEPTLHALTDEELRGTTVYLRNQLASGSSLESLLPYAFAAVREAARRVLDMRHYEVQLLAGIVLSEGCVAEMGTGEGKTLVATLPAFLASLEGQGAHIVTVNDYLARRDAEWVGKALVALGTTVGVATAASSTAEAQAAFARDVTYVTAQQLGFTYLRDGLAADGAAELVLRRPPAFALVDEADAALVDECATPLVVSAQTGVSEAARWRAGARAARELRALRLDPAAAEDEALKRRADEVADAILAPSTRQATLTTKGHAAAVQALGEYCGVVDGKLRERSC